MGAPLKLSVGTSGFILSVVDTSAACVLNRGAVLPIRRAFARSVSCSGARRSAALAAHAGAHREAPRARGARPRRRALASERLRHLMREHEIYARWLAAGTRIAFAVLLATFLVYMLGLLEPLVSPRELARLGSAGGQVCGCDRRAHRLAMAWFSRKGDYLNFIGVAALASISIVCYARMIPTLPKLQRGSPLSRLQFCSWPQCFRAAESSLSRRRSRRRAWSGSAPSRRPRRSCEEAAAQRHLHQVAQLQLLRRDDARHDGETHPVATSPLIASGLPSSTTRFIDSGDTPTC